MDGMDGESRQICQCGLIFPKELSDRPAGYGILYVLEEIKGSGKNRHLGLGSIKT